MNDQFAENQPRILSPAEVLRLWADKIEKNAADDFSGAFVILPPSGPPISALFIDPEQDTGTFFAVVKSKLETAIDDVNDKQRAGNGFR